MVCVCVCLEAQAPRGSCESSDLYDPLLHNRLLQAARSAQCLTAPTDCPLCFGGDGRRGSVPKLRERGPCLAPTPHMRKAPTTGELVAEFGNGTLGISPFGLSRRSPPCLRGGASSSWRRGPTGRCAPAMSGRPSGGQRPKSGGDHLCAWVRARLAALARGSCAGFRMRNAGSLLSVAARAERRGKLLKPEAQTWRAVKHVYVLADLPDIEQTRMEKAAPEAHQVLGPRCGPFSPRAARRAPCGPSFPPTYSFRAWGRAQPECGRNGFSYLVDPGSHPIETAMEDS